MYIVVCVCVCVFGGVCMFIWCRLRGAGSPLYHSRGATIPTTLTQDMGLWKVPGGSGGGREEQVFSFMIMSAIMLPPGSVVVILVIFVDLLWQEKIYIYMYYFFIK